MQRAHLDQINNEMLVRAAHDQHKAVASAAAAVVALAVHIVRNQVAHLALVLVAVPVVRANALEQAAHSAKVAQRRRVIRVRRRAVKRSTICKLQQSVAQSFRAVMEILKYV